MTHSHIKYDIDGNNRRRKVEHPTHNWGISEVKIVVTTDILQM